MNYTVPILLAISAAGQFAALVFQLRALRYLRKALHHLQQAAELRQRK